MNTMSRGTRSRPKCAQSLGTASSRAEDVREPFAAVER